MTTNRGNTLGSLGRQTEAIESYRKAIAVPGNQPSENSSKDQLERSRIPTLVNLGNAIKKQDQNEAAECYEHAIEIGSRLIEQDPSQLRVQIEVAGGRVNLASIHSSEGDCRTALKLLDTAREALSRALHHQVLGNYARGFLSNALTSERRCFQQLLRHPPQGDDLNLVRDSFTSTINWSEKQLKQWPANHPNHSLCAYHLAYVLNSRAWLLATDPREDVREGEQAFEDADRACRMTAYKAWGYIDTLAAACGELERFPLAANWQQQAIEMAPPEYQQRMQARLELYRAHNAYRQELNDVVKEDASSNQDLDPS